MTKNLNAREIAISGLLSALVAAVTLILRIHVPATSGYFNLGEAAIYTAALLFGPRIGGIAGGLGSALADIIGGYTVYAPATLLIKGAEGYLVGLLREKQAFKPAVLASILAVACLVGSLFVERNIIGIATWIIVGVLAGLAAAKMAPKDLPAMLAGGTVMVLGYFLYEYALYGAGAFSEIPWNIGQVAVGILVASLVKDTLKRRLQWV